MTSKIASAIATIEVLTAFEQNIAALEAALAANPQDSILVWPEYWLGVKINGDKCSAVRVDMATRVPRNMRGTTITNGKGEYPANMKRSVALKAAIEHSRKSLQDMEDMLATM